MDTLTNFRSIEELVKTLDKEKTLLREMFERRKTLAFRMDFALEVTEYKHERIRYLIDHGVIHENGDFLEMEDVYVQFFEDVLDMNEEISVASIDDYISYLKENIDYYLQETNEHRRFQYHGNVRKTLRRIGLRTLKNVVDLKRNVDSTYKQEPNYKIKKNRLVNLDEKRRNISKLIEKCEKVLETQALFFGQAEDPEMVRTCKDVRNDFTEAVHNLMEIERQIIDYINRIEQQSALFKKIRRLKYLKDQLTWREDTDVATKLDQHSPLWMERRPYNKIMLSIDNLRGSEDAYTIIRRIASKAHIKRQRRSMADPIDDSYLEEADVSLPTINVTEMWNAFKAQGRDLFTFILNYNYGCERTFKDHIVLFCQMATTHCDELRITDEYRTIENIEFAIIYAS